MESVNKFFNNKAVVYTILALFCVFLACTSIEYDYDLYARLIVGEIFIDGAGFTYQDFLSYTPTHIWYDHEWGSGVVFYLILKYIGPFGLILLQALTMFITGFFICKIQSLHKKAYPVSTGFMACFLALYMHQNPSILRCHLFSYMFCAMFLYFLEKHRTRGSKLIWLIPFITIIWNNLHGGIVAGLGLVFIYMVGAIISRKSWKEYLFVLLPSIILLAVNPYGFEYFGFLLSANTKNRSYITEWWTVFSLRHVLYYFTQFFICSFVLLHTLIVAIKKKKLEITHFLILLVTTILGTLHVKLLSLSLIVVAAYYYNDIVNMFKLRTLIFAEKAARIAVIAAIVLIPAIATTKPLVNLGKIPVKEVEFLKLNDLKGNIVTEFGHGSYLSYKLYPNNLIYMDGRYEEVYYDTEFEELMNYESANTNWESFPDKYPTDILMPDLTIPVYQELLKNKDWVKIYEGNLCGIFVRKENAKKNYKQPTNDINYYRETHFNQRGQFSDKSKITEGTNE